MTWGHSTCVWSSHSSLTLLRPYGAALGGDWSHPSVGERVTYSQIAAYSESAPHYHYHH